MHLSGIFCSAGSKFSKLCFYKHSFRSCAISFNGMLLVLGGALELIIWNFLEDSLPGRINRLMCAFFEII